MDGKVAGARKRLRLNYRNFVLEKSISDEEKEKEGMKAPEEEEEKFGNKGGGLSIKRRRIRRRIRGLRI